MRDALDGIGWLGWSMLALALVLFGIVLVFWLRQVWDQLFNGDVPLGEEHDEGWWI